MYGEGRTNAELARQLHVELSQSVRSSASAAIARLVSPPLWGTFVILYNISTASRETERESRHALR